MTKRLFSMIVALMLVVGIFVIPAMAAQGDSTILPRGPICPTCNSNCILSTTYNWIPVEQKGCVHGLSGYDMILKEQAKTKRVCTGCGDERTSTYLTGNQTRVCYGYN